MNRKYRQIPFFLFIFIFSNLLLQAYLKSFTTDEPVRLVAGLLYLKKQEFSVNIEHPPLTKLLGALIPYISGFCPQETLRPYPSFFLLSIVLGLALITKFSMLIIGSGGLCSFLIQKKSYWQIFIVLILIWSALETARAFPDYISYFNPIAGGYKKGWKRLSDSNAEWGQDIKILAKFCKKNHINEIEAYCFNCWLLPCYGIKFRFFSPLREIYLKKWGKETVSFIEGHPPSKGKASPYLAIGSSFLIAPPQAVMPEISALEAQIIKKKLLLFQKRRPVAVIGKTIFLFKKS